MKTIMKKDLLLHQSAFLVILLLIPFTYIVNIYPIPPVIGGFYGYFIGLFYYDQKVNANQFLVSLPITRATIINARYVFTILTFLGLLVYWYLIDFIAHNVLPYLSFEPMPFQVYIVIFFWH